MNRAVQKKVTLLFSRRRRPAELSRNLAPLSPLWTLLDKIPITLSSDGNAIRRRSEEWARKIDGVDLLWE